MDDLDKMKEGLYTELFRLMGYDFDRKTFEVFFLHNDTKKLIQRMYAGDREKCRQILLNGLRFALGMHTLREREYPNGQGFGEEDFDDPPDPPSSKRDVIVEHDPSALLRAAALSRYYASDVAELPEVQRFRQDNLGGRVLSPDDARAVLNSPANRYLNGQWFKDREIPVVGHESEIQLPDGSPQPSVEGRATPILNPSVILLRYGDKEERIQFDWDGPGGTAFYYTTGDGCRTRAMLVAQYSVLFELRKVAGEIAAYLPGWDPKEAAWFVLCGEVPALHPLVIESSLSTSSYGQRCHLIIKVDPSVSPEVVEKAYRAARGQILKPGPRNSKPTTKTPRQPTDKRRDISMRHIALFNFLVESDEAGRVDLAALLRRDGKTRRDGKMQKWDELRRAWNDRQEQADWKYTSKLDATSGSEPNTNTVRAFRQACIDVIGRMLYPYKY